MKRIGRELLDMNRAAVGVLSGGFSAYMLYKGSIDLIVAIDAVPVNHELTAETDITSELIRASSELTIALAACVFGQVQIAMCVRDDPTQA